MNKGYRRYLLELKLLLPMLGRLERRFLKRFRREVDCYKLEHKLESYQEFCEHFGKPQEVAAAYWDTVDDEQILKRLQLFYVLKWIVIVLAIVLVITFVVKTSIYCNISKVWEDMLMGFSSLGRKTWY